MHDRAWLRRIDSADPADTDSVAWSTRYDRGGLRKPIVRADGTLLVEGFVVRPGVYNYRDASGKITRELIPIETIRDSAPGLARLAVVLEHPEEDVSPDNVGALQVGDTDGTVVIHDDGFTSVKMAVRRRDAIDDVRSGKRTELSPGYRVRVDPTPGKHPLYGEYDAVQVSREYNHLAIVSAARGGAEIRLRADSAEAVDTLSGTPPPTPAAPRRGVRMDDLIRALALLGIHTRYDSVEAASKALADALAARKDSESAETARRDAAATEAKTKITAAEAARDSEKARADGLAAEVERYKAAEKARTDAAERAEDDKLATALGIDPKAHADSKSLRKAIATKHLGTLKADADDTYVNVVVDIARETVATRADGLKAGADAWTPPADAQRTDGANTDSAFAKPTEYLSPAQVIARRNADAFNAARGTRSTG